MVVFGLQARLDSPILISVFWFTCCWYRSIPSGLLVVDVSVMGMKKRLHCVSSVGLLNVLYRNLWWLLYDGVMMVQ